MNNIKFYLNMNDDVIKCEYYEKIDDFKYELIILPPKELYDIFSQFLKKYDKSLSEEQNGDINILTFNDVDVFEIDKIIRRNRQYKLEEMKKKEMLSYNNKSVLKEKSKSKKVVRKNKFKKVFIRTSAAVLTTLVMYSLVNEISDNIDINKIFFTNDIEYTTPTLMEFKSHDNVFPISDFEFNDDTKKENISVSETNDLDTWEKEIEPTLLETTPIVDTPVLETNEEEIVSNETIEETMIDNTDNIEIVPDYVFSLNADDWTETDKYFVADAYYRDAITKIASTYGIDPQLALAIGIHERGLHSEYVDAGGAIGLFQIQVQGGWNWNGRQITAYNFDTESYETVTITADSVSDVFENIKVGCMIIQDMLIRNNYNVLKTVTEYNYGADNLRYVIENCSYDTGYRIDELNSMDNLEWLNYRNLIHGGDPNYLENVFKYIPSGTILSFTKPDGTTINMQYNNSNVMQYNI